MTKGQEDHRMTEEELEGAAARLARITALRARVEELEGACRQCISLLETVEAKALVGDEGCLWPVEVMRAALSSTRGTPPITGGETISDASLADIANDLRRDPRYIHLHDYNNLALAIFELQRRRAALSPPPQDGGSGEGNSSPAVAAPFDPDEYRVLATGSRHARHDGPIVRVMNGYFEKHGKHLTVAAGGMRGVDTLVEQWCEDRGVPFRRYAVDHAIDGPWPAAGPRRNKRMHDDFKPHEVVSFPGGNGTASMVGIARRAETPVNEVRYV